MSQISCDETSVDALFSDVEVFEPFPMRSVIRTTHITYLDTTGRPFIVFKKDRITDNHTNPVYVRISL